MKFQIFRNSSPLNQTLVQCYSLTLITPGASLDVHKSFCSQVGWLMLQRARKIARRSPPHKPSYKKKSIIKQHNSIFFSSVRRGKINHVLPSSSSSHCQPEEERNNLVGKWGKMEGGEEAPHSVSFADKIVSSSQNRKEEKIHASEQNEVK